MDAGKAIRDVAVAETMLTPTSCRQKKLSEPEFVPDWTPNKSYTEQLPGNLNAQTLNDCPLDWYNDTMKKLSKYVRESFTPLTYQLSTSWNTTSEETKQSCVENALEGCRIVCKMVAPMDGDRLFQRIKQSNESVSGELIALMTAHKRAPTRNTKIQILSIYAHRYPRKELMRIHEPYEKLTKWEIDRARLHATKNGPGSAPEKHDQHRTRLPMDKVDHFLDFVNRPYFYQDVAFGTRKLKLSDGDTVSMPNVIRTVTRSTMISQYMQYCEEDHYQPVSRSTLFRILDVREASQRKSLQGLDNTAADGSAGFQTLKRIVDEMEHVGVGKEWAIDIKKKLDEGKNYLKTDYVVHCKEQGSPCADHCRMHALR